MHICIIEDDSSRNFYPLAYLRPVYDLRCGVFTLREKILAHLAPSGYSMVVRPMLSSLVSEENPGVPVNTLPNHGKDTLFLNGRVIMNREIARILRKEKGEVLFTSGKSVVGLRTTREVPSHLRGTPASLLSPDHTAGFIRRVELEVTLAEYPWDLLYANGDEIVRDAGIVQPARRKRGSAARIHKSVVFIRRTRIRVGDKSVLGAGVVLDASEGPILIGTGVIVQPHAVIQGPASIGDGTLVKSGTRINPHTTVGPVCKVAGEIEHSIIQGYANKAHEGYLGHSFLGSWVNLGAGTTTSNLKNTYGTVKALVNGRSVDSGKMFLGLTAGDHVKTGINATLDTGTMIGVSSNIFGTELPPKYVPSFSWGSGRTLVPYDLSRALLVADRVMARRSVPCTEAYSNLLKDIFRMTLHERAGDTATV
ncbi:MAG: putative sugar nucleotidyl transferase [Ignavibacteria bacterium]|nr:putative sugar nucleotidyl transferase [Ignavibacteria bacterium]